MAVDVAAAAAAVAAVALSMLPAVSARPRAHRQAVAALMPR